MLQSVDCQEPVSFMFWLQQKPVLCLYYDHHDNVFQSFVDATKPGLYEDPMFLTTVVLTRALISIAPVVRLAVVTKKPV